MSNKPGLKPWKPETLAKAIYKYLKLSVDPANIAKILDVPESRILSIINRYKLWRME